METKIQGVAFKWNEPILDSCSLILLPPPSAELVDTIVHEVGQRAKDAMKVEVPFASILERTQLSENRWWEGTTKRGIDVPLGPLGARKVQELSIGTGTSHHALVVGRPGSGKTNLMHVIITSLGLKYSPDEITLYLIDFKKGVGFKAYADELMPHAKVIAIESEREFGLSVLQGLDEELKHRGEVFRKYSTESIAEYRDKSGEQLPRILLVADEFQEFFTQDDAIAREATLLLDRLVRQGRAFGMHILLGSQTLAGSYSLSRSTIDQMGVRIALQCSEADSRLILADDNPAARLLSRPGEAIYNAASGLEEGNNLFQVALFTDEDKVNYLRKIRSKVSKEKSAPSPIIFEGHEPAKLDECGPICEALRRSPSFDPQRGIDTWVGEPIAIRPSTAVKFRHQSGSNLVIVTRDEVQGLGVLAASLLGLASQHAARRARFIVADFASSETPWAEALRYFTENAPHEIRVIGRRTLKDELAGIVKELDDRADGRSPIDSNLFFIIQGLHRARDLRKDEDDYSSDSPSDLFMKVLREGPEFGIHTITWSDTYSSITRTLGHRGLREFALRIAGPMSNDDSQNLLDDSAAAKLDRPHRMIFFDEDRPGVLEKFRPYAIPTQQWLSTFSNQLHSRGLGGQ